MDLSQQKSVMHPSSMFTIGLTAFRASVAAIIKSLHDRIDTLSATGKPVFHILAALSEFDRSLTQERIEAGVDSAKARGRRLGRAPAITGTAPHSSTRYRPGMAGAAIAHATGSGRSTGYRYLDARETATA